MCRAPQAHDEVSAVNVKGHASQADVQAGRSTHLFRKGNNFADVFAKRGADTHKPPFRVARTVLAFASLAKQAEPRLRWVAAPMRREVVRTPRTRRSASGARSWRYP